MAGILALLGPYCPWIQVAHRIRRPDPWTLPQRRLSNYLLVCTLEGEEWLRVEGQPEELRVPEGASYLLPPRLLVDKGTRSGNHPVMVHFDLAYDERREHRPRQGAYEDLGGKESWIQPAPSAVWGVELPILLPEALWPAVAAMLPIIVEDWNAGESSAVLRATHHLHGLLLDFVDWASAHAAPQPGNDEDRIARAERVARQSLGSPFGVADFARAAGLQRSRFHQLYRQLRTMTPAAFLRSERLELAARLLTQRRLPIAEAGRLVGYDDPAVFSRVFRRHHGLPPSEWIDRGFATS